MPRFNKICETIFGIHSKVYSWAYVNQAIFVDKYDLKSEVFCNS
jgi:hypothetical protein